MVLGTVVAQSAIPATWISWVGFAFDGYRLHGMNINSFHHVINRQNFDNLGDEIIAVLPVTVGSVRGLTFDGKHFWTLDSGAAPPGTVVIACYKLEDAVNPPILRNIPVGWNAECLAFDGKHLYVAGAGGRIDIFDIASGTLIDTWATGIANIIYGLTFDGKYFWACEGVTNTVYCLNPRSRVIVTSFGFPPAPDSWPFAITFDGKYLWIGTYPDANGTIYCVEKS